MDKEIRDLLSQIDDKTLENTSKPKKELISLLMEAIEEGVKNEG